jgi:hypothetical protein
MVSNDVIAWMWVHDEKLIKARYNKIRKTFIILDEFDNILLKRNGIEESHIKEIELIFLGQGTQRMDAIKQS